MHENRDARTFLATPGDVSLIRASVWMVLMRASNISRLMKTLELNLADHGTRVAIHEITCRQDGENVRKEQK
jgi:hypothetical protein